MVEKEIRQIIGTNCHKYFMTRLILLGASKDLNVRIYMANIIHIRTITRSRLISEVKVRSLRASLFVHTIPVTLNTGSFTASTSYFIYTYMPKKVT